MLGELCNTLAQNGNLNFRTASVAFMSVKIGNDLCFYFLVKWHDIASPE
jgi:hypothetical protein